jgi:uncharacterized protein YkwD
MRLAVALVAILGCARLESSSASNDANHLELRMVELINEERAARGLAAFVHSPSLSDAGRDYSAIMAAERRLSHDLKGSFRDRIRGALANVCLAGENVSKDITIDYSLANLMASPSHRANLLSEQFTTIGVGIARGEDDHLYITQEFARLCAKGAKPERSSEYPHSIRSILLSRR